MNRRGFLTLLAGAAAIAAVPELFVPKRTFFLPPAGGWLRDDYYSLEWPNVLREKLAQDMADAYARDHVILSAEYYTPIEPADPFVRIGGHEGKVYTFQRDGDVWRQISPGAALELALMLG